MNLIEPKDASQVRIGLILPGEPDKKERETLILSGGAIGKSFPPDFDKVDVTEVGTDEADPIDLTKSDDMKRLILPTEPEDKRVVNDLGEETSSMSFPKYIALRPKTCKPRPITKAAIEGASKDFGAVGVTQPYGVYEVREAQIAELTQATLEFIGEAGELGGLFFEAGPGILWGDARKKLIDEAGDILFTGMWAIDSWCLNPATWTEEPVDIEDAWDRSKVYHNPFLDVEGDTEIIRVTDDDILAQIATHVIHRGGMRLREDKQFMQIAGSTIAQSVTVMTTCSALTANAAKKLIFQRREQDIPEQLKRITTALYHVNAILVMANSSIEEAMLVNRAKLDKRFPGGYKPGQGGGIRTEG